MLLLACSGCWLCVGPNKLWSIHQFFRDGDKHPAALNARLGKMQTIFFHHFHFFGSFNFEFSRSFALDLLQ
jgi:hypothetical protein